MAVEPAAVAAVVSAVSLLGSEYLKGAAGEAGKATWSAVKSLLGWGSDPPAAEIAPKVAQALAESPEIGVQLLRLLKTDGRTASLVHDVVINGGKVVFAERVDHLEM